MYDKLKDFQLSILALILAIGIIISSVVVTGALSKDNISVTGSASKIVKSDSAAWTFNIKAKTQTKSEAYKLISTQLPVVTKYLADNGIKQENIDIMVPNSFNVNKTNSNTGYTTNETAYVDYTQPVKISSDDVEKVKKISTEMSKLIEQGIDIESDSTPDYQYSKLSELKVGLLKEATLDAKSRAKSMLKSNNNKVGKIRSAKMGVFQITPVDSNSVTDDGVNDLSSIEKKVTAVANVVFTIK